MVATIQFVSGIDETVTDVKIRASRTSDRKTAVFVFDNPKARDTASKVERMRMSDEEGSIECINIQARFLNGAFVGVICEYEMQTEAEFKRFMRFMDSYAAANGLEFGRR